MIKQKHFTRLTPYIRPHVKLLFFGIMFCFLRTLIDSASTYYIYPILDQGLQDFRHHYVMLLPVLLFGSIGLRALFSALADYHIKKVSRSIVTKLRQDIFRHALHLPISYHDQHSSSQIVSKIIFEAERIAYISAHAFSDLAKDASLLVGLLGVMFAINWRLSLFFFTTIFFSSWCINQLNSRVRQANQALQQSVANTTERANEAIQGVRIVRCFNAEDLEIKKFYESTTQMKKADISVAKVQSLNEFNTQLILAMGISVIVGLALYFPKIFHMTPGIFLAISFGLLQLIEPLKRLAIIHTSIQQSLAGTESIFNFLDLPVEECKTQIGATSKVSMTLCHGDIKFDQVTFSYQHRQPTFKNICFNIYAGEKIALVGHTGSGKSTLLKLLLGLYKPQSGEISLDGHSINSFPLKNLRETISMVSQEVVLFNDTVANNIAYGQHQNDLKDIIEAAKLADIHHDIMKLPQQYHTYLGEHGLHLSGGQRQKIAIARALLKPSPILILDEATSSLDAVSEQKILSAINKYKKNCTCIMITHRLTAITHANRIFVLNHGQILEQGTHHDLLNQGGYYAHLFGMHHESNQKRLEHI